MGRCKQYSKKETSGKVSKSTVAYANWQQQQSSSPNTTSTPQDVPAAVKYDVSYETSFYQHYFDTGVEKEKTFAPAYRVASTVDPYQIPGVTPGKEGEVNHWIHFYFNSKFDGLPSQMVRPNLHLVIALDVSGSMGEPFKGERTRSKIQIAQHSLLALLRQLKPEDSFGLVIFNSEARVIQTLTPWKDVDSVDLEKQIMALRAGGGTTISAALREATNMYTTKETEREGYSNRIIYLTDLEVSGDDERQFKDSVVENSTKSLWSTVVGVGLDLTQDVIKRVSKTPGCNYCNVRSTASFDELMNQEFPGTVFPIAFDIKLNLVSQRYRIVKGYGSYEVSDLVAGDTVVFSTEFPSLKNAKGETRSGVILFRVEDKQPDLPEHEPFTVDVTWNDASGVRNKDSQTLKFGTLPALPPAPAPAAAESTQTTTTTTTTTTSTPTTDTEAPAPAPKASVFENSGVRKAILLVRFTDFVKKYLEVRAAESTPENMEKFTKMKQTFPVVVEHFRDEMAVLDDLSLNEELKHLLEMAQMDDIKIEMPKKVDDNNNNTPGGTTTTTDNKPATITPTVTSATLQIADSPSSADEGLCVICLATEGTITLHPCNHKCLCDTCFAHPITTCPLCRAAVTSTD